MNSELAAMIRPAPMKSSRCGRSLRGRCRSSETVIVDAAIPMAMLSQKIIDQCRYCARKPPSNGPLAPALM